LSCRPRPVLGGNGFNLATRAELSIVVVVMVVGVVVVGVVLSWWSTLLLYWNVVLSLSMSVMPTAKCFTAAGVGVACGVVVEL
jgi:hypothetical protein